MAQDQDRQEWRFQRDAFPTSFSQNGVREDQDHWPVYPCKALPNKDKRSLTVPSSILRDTILKMSE
jgi:hypothetical protein